MPGYATASRHAFKFRRYNGCLNGSLAVNGATSLFLNGTFRSSKFEKHSETWFDLLRKQPKPRLNLFSDSRLSSVSPMFFLQFFDSFRRSCWSNVATMKREMYEGVEG